MANSSSYKVREFGKKTVFEAWQSVEGTFPSPGPEGTREGRFKNLRRQSRGDRERTCQPMETTKKAAWGGDGGDKLPNLGVPVVAQLVKNLT